jgi:hypothetical protein
VGGKGRIPWTRLQEAQGDFVLAEYLPNSFIISQYHHTRLEDANALLQHWTQRQAAGEIPFRFKKVGKADHQSKPSSGEDNASTGVGPSHIHGNQEQGSDGDQGDGEGSAEGRPDGKGTGGSARGPSNVC